jgi:hypothetical protein
MELDSQSLDSDEEVDLSVKDHEELYPGLKIMHKLSENSS